MAVLKSNMYGKSQVRLTKVTRNGQRHELKEMYVNVILRGEFQRCYTHGDNSNIVATDSMKNTVYALARNHPIESIESFGMHLAAHFVDRYPQVSAAQVKIRQVPWQRIAVNGQPHDHAFIGGSSERRTCLITHGSRPNVSSGIDGLLVMKTTHSGFVGYVQDEYTTLKETTDRIFATSVTASWKYDSPDADWNANYDSIRAALLNMFATHDSLAVQQTLYAMGEEALKVCPAISEIELTMPNQHRLLVNLQPLGLDNPNEIFLPTSEPFGMISGIVSRG